MDTNWEVLNQMLTARGSAENITMWWRLPARFASVSTGWDTDRSLPGNHTLGLGTRTNARWADDEEGDDYF